MFKVKRCSKDYDIIGEDDFEIVYKPTEDVDEFETLPEVQVFMDGEFEKESASGIYGLRFIVEDENGKELTTAFVGGRFVVFTGFPFIGVGK